MKTELEQHLKSGVLQAHYGDCVKNPLNLVHNNEDYNPHCHVWSDDKYDYAIVNGESITRYYGPNGGDYESFPLHLFQTVNDLLDRPGYEWVHQTLVKDLEGPKLYKYSKELAIKIAREKQCTK